MFRSFWGITSPYGQQIYLPDAILGEKPYPIKAMIVSGGNPVASWPDSKKLKKAFRKLDMLVVMDLFMTDTAKLADIVLPACSSLEMMGLAYNYGLTGGMPFAMLSRKVIEPIGGSWPDWKFYTELGRKMGYSDLFPWNTDEEVVEYLLEASKLTLKELEEHPEGIWFGERCYDINARNQIRTPSGKIEIYSETLEQAGYDPIPIYREPSASSRRSSAASKDFPLTLNTGARIKEYTHWQMRHVPQLREMAPDPVAEIHPETAREYGIADGNMVITETRTGQIKVRAKVTEDILPGIVNVMHGWAEDLNQNVLTELKACDPVTGYPELRALACRIRKAA
jgi:anaerobic selenocysteine-containing dehydrogenase